METNTTADTGRRAERLDEVVQLVRSKVAADPADQLAAFVTRYFGRIPPGAGKVRGAGTVRAAR